MRRVILSLAALAFGLGTLFLSPAGADHGQKYSTEGRCGSKGQKALGVIEIAGQLYIDDRAFVGGNGFWVYKESNGIKHLQRGGKDPIGGPEVCEAWDGVPGCSEDGSTCSAEQGYAPPENYKPDLVIF